MNHLCNIHMPIDLRWMSFGKKPYEVIISVSACKPYQAIAAGDRVYCKHAGQIIGFYDVSAVEFIDASKEDIPFARPSYSRIKALVRQRIPSGFIEPSVFLRIPNAVYATILTIKEAFVYHEPLPEPREFWRRATTWRTDYPGPITPAEVTPV